MRVMWSTLVHTLKRIFSFFRFRIEIIRVISSKKDLKTDDWYNMSEIISLWQTLGKLYCTALWE